LLETNSILDKIRELSDYADRMMLISSSNSKSMQKVFSEANIIGGKIYLLLVQMEKNTLSENEKRELFEKMDILIKKIKLLLEICQNIINNNNSQKGP